MRALTWLVLASLVAIAIASPVSARVVRMETTVALADHTGPSVDRALRQALDTAVRGAIAMGFSSMWVHDARVLAAAVILQLVATDEQFDDEDD